MITISHHKDNRYTYIFGVVGMHVDNFITGGDKAREARAFAKREKKRKKEMRYMRVAMK